VFRESDAVGPVDELSASAVPIAPGSIVFGFGVLQARPESIVPACEPERCGRATPQSRLSLPKGPIGRPMGTCRSCNLEAVGWGLGGRVGRYPPKLEAQKRE